MRALAILLALGTASVAAAQDREQVQLRYDPPAGCPSEQTFRDIVAGRLGYDPFTDEGTRTAIAIIETSAGGYRGRVELVDAEGASQGERSFDEVEPSCAELARSIAIAITLTLDPLGVGAAAAPEEPGPELREHEDRTVSAPARDNTPPAVLSASTQIAAVERAAPGFIAQVGLVGAVRSAPDPTLGPTGAFGVHWGPWRALVGASADRMLTAARVASGDAIEVHLWSAFVGVCGEVSVALGCASIDVGQLAARGRDLANESLRRDRYGALRLSGGVEFALAGPLSLQALAELRIPWFRTHLVIEDERVWSLPRASARISLALVFRFGQRIDDTATSTER